MKRTVLAGIWLYQRVLSPFLPTACRYTPTCYRYSHQAVEKYGAMRGTWIGVRRLVRCHPFGGKGYDPVP